MTVAVLLCWLPFDRPIRKPDTLICLSLVMRRTIQELFFQTRLIVGTSEVETAERDVEIRNK